MMATTNDLMSLREPMETAVIRGGPNVPKGPPEACPRPGLLGILPAPQAVSPLSRQWTPPNIRPLRCGCARRALVVCCCTSAR